MIHRLTKLLVIALGDRADVRVQLPLAVSDDSEPEPDVAVVATADPFGGHPSTALLVIEVAQSSLGKERGVKAGLYAAAGVAEYWIVDVTGGSVEVHRDPVRGRYSTMSTVGRGAVLKLVALEGVAVDVTTILPPG